MSVEDYKHGMMYETFMSRAFNTSDNSKPGIHISNMTNLINAENGDTIGGMLPSREQQFKKVQSYVEKAFEKLLKRFKSDEKLDALFVLKERIIKSQSSNEILDIIEEGMKITQPK